MLTVTVLLAVAGRLKVTSVEALSCTCVGTRRMKYCTEYLTTNVTTARMFPFLFSEDVVSVIYYVIFRHDCWQS